jgi:hypothetical protein
MRHARAASNSSPGPSVQGTMGGPAPSVGSKPGRMQVKMDDSMYLWILVLLEVGTIAWLRAAFSRYHGG